MFLGNVGSSHRLDFIVSATEVNIAQRLAEEALSGQIMITERVYRKLDDSFQSASAKSSYTQGDGIR